MPRPLHQLPMPTGPAVLDLLPRLADALAGGPAIQPLRAGSAAATTTLDAADDDPADPTAIVMSTSGSTGEAKRVLLPTSALTASAAATEQRLGGPGGWLLTLPAHHVAGLQVLLRAAGAGTPIVVSDTGNAFTAAGFVAAAATLRTGRRYVSLVPTQLHRILADRAATDTLAGFDAVLVGGAATAPELLARSRSHGIQAITTYGMSETCGGCVYDGRPLDGAGVTIGADGRISLSGPMIARGYLGLPGHPAFPAPGTFVTDDLGVLAGGELTVTGRADDMIVTGGLKVPPAVVERAIGGLDGIGEVLIVGVPHREWGQQLVGVVTGVIPTDDQLAAALADLPRHYRPRRWVQLAALPLRGPGKPDRAAATRAATVQE